MTKGKIIVINLRMRAILKFYIQCKSLHLLTKQGFLLQNLTGMLFRMRVFIFQVQSESSPRSLEFFFFKLTEYNIWWLYFSVMEYYYTTNGSVITPFPYACFSS